ncbi:penicillin-binding protein 2 [Puia dinghuensis]|uniref:Penicillin-binding protein 2 n=1 Tax=Puia dinghuensis TaxID=1792502 RepID=A0A8J2UET3_9BACT|nr:penicillin-binding protein 2 [Puia dinghuensis]GGB07681.1 penicillin-binding protein 2 [Puia dinghuensis]
MPVFNQSRSNIIRLIFAGMFLIIFAQLFHLQIVSKKYKQQAQENALFRKSVYPTRGIIYDRKGRAILNNTILYDLMVTPSQVKNIDTTYFCQLVGIDTAEFHRRIVDARVKNGPFRPTTFQGLLPPEMYARMEENIWKFPGFNLQERPVRVYPYNAAAHIMGYVGEVDSAILRRSNNFYQLGDYVGRSGLEQYYEKALMGQRGIEFWIKDNKNRLVGRYADKNLDTPAVAGKNLHTYLDIELQQLAERLLYGKTGAVVAIEPSTGGILAMVSGPSYDPNALTGPDKQNNYARLVLDESRPLFNRAIKGQYQSGSTYKPIGALIGLDEGVITPASGYDCHGVYLACSKPIKCEEHWAGHAANLRLAIAHSCNSFFCNTFRLELDDPEFHSVRRGLMKWKEYVNAFGLGHRLGVDIPSEDGGNIPDTSAYDKEYNHLWNSCSMATMGIGQDKLEVTPLQMANAMCIVANKGYYYTPHFVRSIEGAPEDDTLLGRFHQKHEPVSHISDADYEVVHSGMQDVTEIGTGRPARIPGIDICSKTGTAENKRVIDGKIVKLKSHSWFVCFAPRDNPKIAVAVIVENGGYGGDQAAPIASLLVEKYLRDTIATSRLALLDDITKRNLMPRYLVRLQFKADSSRAADWARQSGDSTRWTKYQTPSFRYMMLDTSDGSRSPLMLQLQKPSPYKSALAERLAKQKAQMAAATIGLDSTIKTAAANTRTKRDSTDPAAKPHTPRTPRKDSGVNLSARKPAGNADSVKQKDSTP